MICSASLDKTMKIWNDEGTCLQLLDAHNRYINCIAFSRSFPILCSGIDNQYLFLNSYCFFTFLFFFKDRMIKR